MNPDLFSDLPCHGWLVQSVACVGVVTVHSVSQHEGGGSNPTPTLQFDSAWKAQARVVECSIADVDHLVRAHYLHKRPGVVVLCLALEMRGIKVATVVFALPPRETSRRYGGPTWELARLYAIDEMPKNTESWLIAYALRFISRNRRDVDAVVSYADPSVGHDGTVYKASNWIADGRTDDERKSPRCDYVDANTGRKYSRRSHMPDDADVRRVPRVSKFRFWFPLKNRKQAAA